MNSIKNTLQEIESQTGLKLVECDYFTGINKSSDKEYFNIVLDKPISESGIYDKLLNILDKGIISKVEPNGYKRLAIFF